MLDGLSKLVTILCNRMQRKSAAIVLYASIMFDEASNIHMSGLLNVFVNLLTNDYQVISIIGFEMHKFMYTLYTHYLLLYVGGENAHVSTN